MRLIIAEFITLDGIIQAPGGSDEDIERGFTDGGWTWPYWPTGVVYQRYRPASG